MDNSNLNHSINHNIEGQEGIELSLNESQVEQLSGDFNGDGLDYIVNLQYDGNNYISYSNEDRTFFVSHNVHGQGDSAKTSENRDIHPIHLNTPKNYEVEEDIEYLFEERAAIYQFDAGYSKSEVERLARIDVMDELESAS